MKSKWIGAIILLILLTGISAASPQTPSVIYDFPVNVAMENPAAVYCTDIMEYEYKVITDSDGSQRGICVLPTGQE